MTKSAIQILEQHAIRPSIQRIEVVKFMLENRIHPSVDDIYSALQPVLPTLSRTTIYNVLKTLESGGVVQPLHLDEHNIRYDMPLEPHAHFRCSRCGRIYDVPLPEMHHFDERGFRVKAVELCYHGLCPDCAEAEHEESIINS